MSKITKKIIQITATKNMVYGLDPDGNVYRLNEPTQPGVPPRWHLLGGKVYSPSFPSCTKCGRDEVTYDDTARKSQDETARSILNTCYTCWNDADNCTCTVDLGMCSHCLLTEDLCACNNKKL